MGILLTLFGRLWVQSRKTSTKNRRFSARRSTHFLFMFGHVWVKNICFLYISPTPFFLICWSPVVPLNPDWLLDGPACAHARSHESAQTSRFLNFSIFRKIMVALRSGGSSRSSTTQQPPTTTTPGFVFVCCGPGRKKNLPSRSLLEGAV